MNQRSGLRARAGLVIVAAAYRFALGRLGEVKVS